VVAILKSKMAATMSHVAHPEINEYIKKYLFTKSMGVAL
jgi:hypothetical protein